LRPRRFRRRATRHRHEHRRGNRLRQHGLINITNSRAVKEPARLMRRGGPGGAIARALTQELERRDPRRAEGLIAKGRVIPGRWRRAARGVPRRPKGRRAIGPSVLSTSLHLCVAGAEPPSAARVSRCRYCDLRHVIHDRSEAKAGSRRGIRGARLLKMSATPLTAEALNRITSTIIGAAIEVHRRLVLGCWSRRIRRVCATSSDNIVWISKSGSVSRSFTKK
jgi:hypothetical protein